MPSSKTFNNRPGKNLIVIIGIHVIAAAFYSLIELWIGITLLSLASIALIISIKKEIELGTNHQNELIFIWKVFGLGYRRKMFAFDAKDCRSETILLFLKDLRIAKIDVSLAIEETSPEGVELTLANGKTILVGNPKNANAIFNWAKESVNCPNG